jgi:hypothetical protein
MTFVKFSSVFLAFFAATVFADTSLVKTESQRNPTPTPAAALQSPASKQGLNFVVGAHGLDSLSYNGQSLLGSPQSGELQPWKSPFRAALDLLFPRSSSPIPTPAKRADTVDLIYPWGRVSCMYGKQSDKITMRIEVSNSGAKKIDELSVRLMELNFPAVPKGGTLEAGMFGFGFKGPEWPLNRWPPSIPSAADPRFVVPIVRADFGAGILNFCSDDLECAVDVPASTNFSAKISCSLVMTCRGIQPGASKTFNVSLRFGPAGAQVQDLSGDVLERYAKNYPFQVTWKDHRPIGAIFLAGPQINVPTNPRRWTMNSASSTSPMTKAKQLFEPRFLSWPIIAFKF